MSARAPESAGAAFAFASPLLRKALIADGLLSGVTGLAFALGATRLATVSGLPKELLWSAAIILIPFAILVGYLGTRARVYRMLVLAVIAANALWTVDSVLLLFTGWVAPTAIGVVFTVAQALVVAVLATLEFIGLRRSTIPEVYVGV